MSDPTRLLAGEADDFEKRLLGSWEAEQPSDEARSKVLAMVGLGAVAGGTAGAGALATKAGAATAGGSVAPKAGAIGAAALAKWLVVGAVGAATAGATLVYARHAQHVSPAPPVTSPAVVAPIASPPVATATGRTEDVAPAPTTPEPPRAAGLPRRAPSVERGARPSDLALGEQVAAVDRARRALADGDTAGALRQIDEYESRFPHGALVEETEVLRVESLLAQGDKPSAARVGGRFLAAHPDSPHAGRVRALLGQGSGP